MVIARYAHSVYITNTQLTRQN
ncbi:hypothetical protein YPPY72_3730, partial [Yersinia pestis PY-72]